MNATVTTLPQSVPLSIPNTNTSNGGSRACDLKPQPAPVSNNSVNIGAGTGAVAIATGNRRCETDRFGNERLMQVPTLVFETAESSRGYSVTLGPGRGSVSLRDDELIILPERTSRELAAFARRHPCLRRDAEQLEALPPVSTKNGAGGHKILAANAAKAADPMIIQSLSGLLSEAKDRRRYSALCDRGTTVVQTEVVDAYIFGTGYGATMAGTVIYLLLRLQHAAKLLDLEVRPHVILTSPTVAKSHDSATAWANFGATAKELILAQSDPSHIRMGLFSGETITPEPDKKLLETFTPWGASNGCLIAGDRDEVSASIGLLLFNLTHSHLSGLSDGAFCDPQKLVQDKSLGFRGLRRLGLARFAVDDRLNREVAYNAALQAIAQMFTPTQN